MSLEPQMRQVLLDLAMLGAGRTTSYNPSGGGGDYTPRAQTGDAPHLEYAARWNAADDDGERAAVLAAARAELDSARRSRAVPTAAESKQDRDARIVREGEGWPARDVAGVLSRHCGVAAALRLDGRSAATVGRATGRPGTERRLPNRAAAGTRRPLVAAGR